MNLASYGLIEQINNVERKVHQCFEFPFAYHDGKICIYENIDDDHAHNMNNKTNILKIIK
jgi:hypothetical protein